jgi:DGQHR domain-containing protein
MKASDILAKADVDRFRETNEQGYQRPLMDSRKSKAAQYLVEEKGTFPQSILVNIRNPVQFSEDRKAPQGPYTSGTLKVPDEEKLWIVDGQHRMAGVKYAIEDMERTEFNDMPIVVSITQGLDRFQEMRLFYIVNTRQKGVPTDIVERNLVQMKEELGEYKLQEMEGENKMLEARGVEITDELRKNPASPWHGKIQVPGEEWGPNTLQRQRPIAVSISETLKLDPTLRLYRTEQLAQLLINYWNAIKDVIPEAFAHPDNYKIQETPGIYSMHLIFPQIFELCREKGSFSKETMADIIGGIDDFSASFWSKDPGNPLTIGTNMKAFKLLATYLRGKLPKPEVAMINMGTTPDASI